MKKKKGTDANRNSSQGPWCKMAREKDFADLGLVYS
jgi:hypothetical protein